MPGETETMSVTPEEASIHLMDATTEEVVATVETGHELSDNNFIITETTNREHEEMEIKTEDPAAPEDNDIVMGDYVESEEVVSNTTEETSVVDAQEVTTDVVPSTETESQAPMETAHIPYDERVSTDMVEEEIESNQNIYQDRTTSEHSPEEESILAPDANIPEEVSEQVTNSVHEQSKPDDNSTEEVFQEEAETVHESRSLSPPPPYSQSLSSIVKSCVETALPPEPTIITRTTLGSTTIGSTVVPTLRTTVTTSHPPPTSHSQLQIPKPPQTDILLQTAREVLQLPEEPGDVKAFLMQQDPELRLGQMAGPVVTETVISSGHQIQQQRLSMEEENSQQMEVSDENATYILEPVTNEEYYQDDQNIMWIQETVEVEQQESYDSLPNMVIILNPNGTVNEELMLAHGMNLETIKAVTDNVINVQGEIAQQQHAGDLSHSIKSLQHPIPRRELIDVKPLFTNQVPRTVVDSVLTDSKLQRSIVEGSLPVTSENSRSVILDAKDNFLVLDELEGHQDHGRDPMIEPLELSQLDHSSQRIININGTNHIVNTGRSIPDLKRAYFPSQQLKDQNGQEMHFQVSNLSHLQLPMGPQLLDLSLPKKQEPVIMDQYVNPASLVSEQSVLKALSGQLLGGKDPLTGKLLRPPGGKVRKPKARDENGNGTPYIHRKTTSLGALGQALHGSMLGIPRDSRENAVQICPICKFQATTKNPYRHLQDHLARMHFKERIAADLPTKKPYICPMAGCDGKHYPDWQAVMRHYIGKKHGILDKFVKETLSEGLFQGLAAGLL